jgi:hypothetical protein
MKSIKPSSFKLTQQGKEKKQMLMSQNASHETA